MSHESIPEVSDMLPISLDTAAGSIGRGKSKDAPLPPLHPNRNGMRARWIKQELFFAEGRMLASFTE